MLTLEIPADKLTDVRAGDRIIAIDGLRLDPITVEAALGAGSVNGIKTVYDSPSGVARYLYPGIVGTAVTVERGAVELVRKKRKKPTSVTIRRYGFPLVHDLTGWYRTEDGRYEIRLNDGYLTSCEAPHPVRLGPESRDYILKNQRRLDVSWEAVQAAASGKDGYRCPGGAEHTYSRWGIWDYDIDDYMDYDPGGFETFAEAARELARKMR